MSVARAAVAAGLAAMLMAAAAAADPRVDYQLECQGCHLPDGSGTPGAVPPLRGAMADLLAVEGGRAFLVQVPGSAQSQLDDARLAALLNWMLAAFDPEDVPADFAPYRAAEVARLRAAPLTDVATARERLRARLAAQRQPASPAPAPRRAPHGVAPPRPRGARRAAPRRPSPPGPARSAPSPRARRARRRAHIPPA